MKALARKRHKWVFVGNAMLTVTHGRRVTQYSGTRWRCSHCGVLRYQTDSGGSKEYRGPRGERFGDTLPACEKAEVLA